MFVAMSKMFVFLLYYILVDILHRRSQMFNNLGILYDIKSMCKIYRKLGII